jgi:general secretion pathway protein A
MYEQYFGLRERPFDLTTNPRFLFLTPKHREALSNLQYGISGRKGITVLIGEAGTGKTTLLRAALASWRNQNVRYAYVSNPTLTRTEFFESLTTGFGLSADAAQSKTRFLLELHRTATERHAAGGITSLIVDEAQSLSLELLEEVRLLANIETSSEKLLPVILVGQPELAARLNEPALRQLKQRVALRCHLDTLDEAETATYIGARLQKAGAKCRDVFTADALRLIHARSRGIPRTINVICDNALVGAFAAEKRIVDAALVLEVCVDFDLRPSESEQPEPPPAFDDPLFSPEVSFVPHAVAVGAGGGQTMASVEAGVLQASEAGGEMFTHFTRRRRFSLF